MFALPASTSGFLRLDGIDVLKILRLAGVVFIGAFCASISSQPDLLSLDTTALLQVLKDAASAGGMALSAAAVEAVRRLFTANV